MFDNPRDEEYQFSEEGAFEETSSVDDSHLQEPASDNVGTSKEKPSLFSNVVDKDKMTAIAQNKRVLIVAGIIAAILIVYYIISPSSSPADDELQAAPVAEAQQNQEAEAIAPAPIIQQEQIAAVPQVAQQTEPAAVQSSAEIDKINNSISDIKYQLNNLARLSQDIGASVVKLSNEVRVVKSQQQRMIAAQTAKKKLMTEKTTFKVRAIMPGMAWLVSSTGKEIVVKIGDGIRNYGWVKYIQPERGIVTMSSGAMFEYGS